MMRRIGLGLFVLVPLMMMMRRNRPEAQPPKPKHDPEQLIAQFQMAYNVDVDALYFPSITKRILN